jgi:hypothetical protein
MADSNSYIQKAGKISSSVKDMSKVNVASASAKAERLLGKPFANYSDKAARLIGPGGRTTTPAFPTTPTDPIGGFADSLIPSKPAEETKPDYSEWGAIGWGFRVITGLGRAVLNTAATSIHNAAEIKRTVEDGIEADELGKIASNFIGMVSAPIVGTVKGLTYSVLPDAKKDIENFTGGKVYDSWTQVLNNEDLTDLGVPKISEDVYWDTALGGWTAKNTVGTTLDILLDPATYATLGIGGAIKGAARGASVATRYVTAADKAGFAEKTLNAPRPFYAPLQKVEGKKLRTRLGNEIELTDPKYTIANTNPYLYILKEMGRGFQEAHQVAFDRWASKTAARTFAKEFEQNLEALGKAELTPDDLMQVGQDIIAQRLALKKATLEAEQKVSAEKINEILLKEANDLGQVVGSVVSPKGIKKLQANLGTRALIRLEQSAAEAGIETPERLVTTQADEVVRSLEGPSPIFRTNRSAAELRAATPVQKLADDMTSASRRADGSAATAWEAWRTDPANAEYIKLLDEAFTQPVGFRQTIARKGAETVERSTKGAESKRKGAGERIGPAKNKEIAFLQGKQAELQPKGKAMVWSGDNISNDWLRIRQALGADTTGTQRISVANLTGEMLQASGVSLSLLASRIKWVSNRLSGQGEDFYAIERVANDGVNPLTNNPEITRSYNLAANAAEKEIAAKLGRDVSPLLRGRIWSLHLEAAGVVRDKEIRNILGRLGLPKESFDAIDGRVSLDSISETIAAAKMNKILAAKKAIQKVAAKKEIKINIKGKPVIVTVDMVADLKDGEVLQVLDVALRRNKLRTEMVTDAELKRVTEYLEDLRMKKMKAIETLFENGIDIFGQAKPTHAVISGTRTGAMGELNRRNFETLFASEKEGASERLMGEFIAYAYRASAHRDSVDGGRFAEAIDDLAEKAGIPPVSELSNMEALSTALKPLMERKPLTPKEIEEGKELPGYAWTEFVTPPLLHTLEARTRSIATAKTTGTLPRSGKFLKAEEARITSRVEEMLERYVEGAVEAKMKLDGYASAKIILSFKRGEKRNTSVLDLADQGKTARGKDLVNGDFPVGIEAADAVLNPSSKDFINYIDATPEVQKIVGSLGVQPGLVSAVLKDGRAVPAAAGEPATHVILTAVLKAVKEKGYKGLSGAEKGLYERLLSKQWETASRNAVRAIAESEVARTLPLALRPQELLPFISAQIRINATSVARVEANIVARFWHAYDLRLAEDLVDQKLVASPNARVVLRGIDGATSLANSKKSFEKLVKKIEEVIAKDSPNLSKPEWDGKMSISDVVDNGNPNLFISWLRKKVVVTSMDQDEWTAAMQHMKNLTQLGGGASPWRNYKELLDSYPNRKNSPLRPGQVNPATGKVIPTEAQVLEVLQALGIEDAAKVLDKKEIIERSDVLALIRNGKKHISQVEIDQVKFNTVFESTLIASGRDVGDIADGLPAPDVTVDQTLHMLASFANELNARGEGWVMDLASYSAGKAFGRFTDMETVLARQAGDLSKPVADIAYEDITSRVLRANFDQTEKGARAALKEKGVKETFIKNNFDIENLYTADKEMFSRLSAIARANNLVLGTEAYENFMSRYATLVINARDLYFNARGIYPSSTISLKRNQHALTARAMGLNYDTLSQTERKALGAHAIYITEGDFIDALGDDIFKQQFCQGPLNSLPITPLFSPTRILIMAMDSLPVGQWFDANELRNLQDIMERMMIEDMKNMSRGIDKKTNTKIKSLLNSNPEETIARVRLLVTRLIQEDVATSLHQAHRLNGGYAVQRFKYEANRIAEPIMTGLMKLLDNDLSSEGMNIKAVKKASKDLDAALANQTDDVMVEIIAKMDFNAVMGARLEPIAAVFMHQSEKVAKAASEANSIQEIQRASAQANVDALESLDPVVFDNLIVLDAMKAVDNNLSDDMMYEMSVNKLAERGNILAKLKGWKTLNRIGRAFATWNMEDLRELVNPITMNTKTVTSEFAEIVARHLLKIKEKYAAFEAQTGRKLSTEAFKALQEIPDEIVVKAFTAIKQLENGAIAKSDQLTKGISKEAYGQLVDDARLLDEFISPDDTMLREAMADMWVVHSRLFSGGEESFIARNVAFEGDFINRTLREIGQGMLRQNIEVIDTATGKVITDNKAAQAALTAGAATTQMAKKADAFAFVQTKDPEAFVNIWREWDIENPYDMYVAVHSATQKVIETTSAAANFTRLFGFAKGSISREEAKAADLVELVLPKRATPGNELLSAIPPGYYFPRAIVEQLKEVSSYLTQVKHLQANGSLERAMIKVQPLQDLAKKMMTQYSPKNWIQNTVGGVTANGLLLGVWSPLAYGRASAVMRAVGIDVEQELGLEPGAIAGMFAAKQTNATEAAFAVLDRRTAKAELQINPVNDPTSSTSFTTRIKNKQVAVSLKDWWDLYVKTVGVVPHSQAGGADQLRELDVLGSTKKRGILRRGYDKGDAFLARWAGNRDDWLRLTAFIDLIQKGNWNSLEEAAAFVSKKVNKVHPQMQGLSAFNQKFTRNFVLFFTWRAKMLGAVLTGVLDKPGSAITVLRLQQFMSEAQGAEYSGFGDFDPNNQLRPSYMKGNMNPTFLNDEGRMSSFTFSNPVTDLLGQGSWVQAIRFNNQDPLEKQLGEITFNTFDNFVTSSQPLLISMANDWIFEKKTQGGSPLMSGNRFTRQTVPLFVEDAASKLGFGPVHIMVALMFPNLPIVGSKASQKGMNVDAATRKNQMVFENWITGLKKTELDTIDIRKKAVQEILARRSDQAGQ